ncbi:sugar ABC transporter substrate-binding protein [Neobacillus sp. 179-C4.2 HS]|uniref:Sugar ABC transporter substrate-binding protein n=1 Tax=Neobacillus driksii TaxID=3035913 RepID=A0ABV4YYS4_9BACI|nr:sugar ABC transporter substrate-binding protein [Neobacillus sp. 179.-C4.2 HS]MDP5196624.1 sugar ABC transporter substrate-binding protein [Neobacillus sp. 179.-C4.2 HS]
MFRKNLTTSVMALIMVIGLVLTGCNGGDSLFQKSNSKEDERIKIVFWDDNTGPQRTPIWEELITRFEKDNPTIDVEYVGLPKDSAKAMFDAAIASGEIPDVASVYTSWLPEFAMRDALLPLDSYFSEWSEKDKINKGAIEFNKLIVRDRKLYGIPYTQNLDILWVRSDWFKAANLNTPETWDEFFHTVEMLSDKSNNRYGYTIRGGAGGSFQLQRMMYAYSGIETFFKDGKSTINDPKHVEFLKKYFALYQNYTPISDITNDYKAMVAGFDSGKIAMVQHNIGSFAEHSEALDSGQFQAIPLPKSVKGNYVAEDGNTIGISIFKGTKHPEESWKFIQFINSKKAQSFWNESVGQLPTNLDVLNEEWIKTSPHIQTAQKVYNDPNTILFEPPFYLSEYRTILNTIVDTGTQSVLSGKMNVEEFLDKWAEAMEDAQQQYDDTFVNSR